MKVEDKYKVLDELTGIIPENDIAAKLKADDQLIVNLSQRLKSCPICRKSAHLEDGFPDFYVICSEDCPSPMCDHHDPRYVAFAWNTWVRWYADQKGAEQN